MKLSNKRGFTLIEVLVVVLIIGILAAVALPQYQKAVEKSKAAQGLSLLKSIAQAEESFYLIHGYYSYNIHNLDLDLSWSKQENWATNMTFSISNGEWAFHSNVYYDNVSVETITLGRLTGPWAGGGFVYILNHQKKGVPFKPGLYCAEHYSNGKVLKGDQGSYCQKLFNRPYTTTLFNDTRIYRM